jgi:hypothetical protein
MNKVIKNPTLFVDIDGTLVKYRKFSELAESTLIPIQDVIDYVNNHHDNGSVVVITTARPDSYRLFTKQELDTLGVRYSQLIMEMGRGTRVILNDIDPENPELPRAIGINLERDGGLKDITIPSYISPYESD